MLILFIGSFLFKKRLVHPKLKMSLFTQPYVVRKQNAENDIFLQLFEITAEIKINHEDNFEKKNRAQPHVRAVYTNKACISIWNWKQPSVSEVHILNI